MKHLITTALSALCIATIDVWVMLSGSSYARLELWPLDKSALLPPSLLPLLGIITGVTGLLAMQRALPSMREAALRANLRLIEVKARKLRAQRRLATIAEEYAPLMPDDTAPYGDTSNERTSLLLANREQNNEGRWLGFGIMCGTASVLAILAVAKGQARALPAAALVLAGATTFVTAAQALDTLRRGDAIEFNTSWGGLGGSLGGWRLSPSTTTVILALIFLAASVTLTSVADQPPANITAAAVASPLVNGFSVPGQPNNPAQAGTKASKH